MGPSGPQWTRGAPSWATPNRPLFKREVRMGLGMRNYGLGVVGLTTPVKRTLFILYGHGLGMRVWGLGLILPLWSLAAQSRARWKREVCRVWGLGVRVMVWPIFVFERWIGKVLPYSRLGRGGAICSKVGGNEGKWGMLKCFCHYRQLSEIFHYFRDNLLHSTVFANVRGSMHLYRHPLSKQITRTWNKDYY